MQTFGCWPKMAQTVERQRIVCSERGSGGNMQMQRSLVSNQKAFKIQHLCLRRGTEEETQSLKEVLLTSEVVWVSFKRNVGRRKTKLQVSWRKMHGVCDKNADSFMCDMCHYISPKYLIWRTIRKLNIVVPGAQFLCDKNADSLVCNLCDMCHYI